MTRLIPRLTHDTTISAAGTIIFTVTSLVCMCTIGVLFGLRWAVLRSHRFRTTSLLNTLVFLIYLNAMGHVFGLTLLLSGTRLDSLGLCRGGVVICLGTYMAHKTLIYLFLTERAYVLRGSRTRSRDRFWLVSLGIVTVGLGAISIAGLVFSVLHFSPVQISCAVGVPTRVWAYLFAYDFTVNVVLTLVFINLLRPTIRRRMSSRQPSLTPFLSRAVGSIRIPGDVNDECMQILVDHQAMMRTEGLIKKTLIGTIMMLIPTMVNASLAMSLDGHQQGWLCFSMCIVDVTWAGCVVHYLTAASLKTVPTIVEPKPKDFSKSSSVSSSPTLAESKESCEETFLKAAYFRNRD